jgi:hypothetical protein
MPQGPRLALCRVGSSPLGMAHVAKRLAHPKWPLLVISHDGKLLL